MRERYQEMRCATTDIFLNGELKGMPPNSCDDMYYTKIHYANVKCKVAIARKGSQRDIKENAKIRKHLKFGDREKKGGIYVKRTPSYERGDSSRNDLHWRQCLTALYSVLNTFSDSG